MEKKYKLTLDFTAHINDEIQGNGNKKTLEYTRQIINHFKFRPELLFEYHKNLLIWRYLSDTGREYIEKHISIKNEDEIMLTIIRELQYEAAEHLMKIFFSNPPETEAMKKVDEEFELLFENLVNIEITNANITEIKKDKDEEKLPISNAKLKTGACEGA